MIANSLYEAILFMAFEEARKEFQLSKDKVETEAEIININTLRIEKMFQFICEEIEELGGGVKNFRFNRTS